MMKPGRQPCPLMWRDRLTTARQIADRGGNLTQVAKAWGVSLPRVIQTLKKRDPELHRDLKDGIRDRYLTTAEITGRLEAIRDHDSIRQAALSIGMKYHSLYIWFSRNFPDGLESGLEDYLEEAA